MHGMPMRTFSRDTDENNETVFEKVHTDDEDVMNWAEQKFGFEDDGFDSDKDAND